jgi:hypothetical protein
MTKQNLLARWAHLRLPLLASLLVAVMVLPAPASPMKFLTLEELASRSSDVLYGQVISTETYWNADRTRIYTRVLVRIGETFKGSLRSSETVTVTQFGGEKDGVRWACTVCPEFSAGENLVLFTTRGKKNNLIVVGLKQGKMTVEGGEVKRDFSGITFVERAPDGRGFRQMAVKPERLTIDQLRKRIGATR